MIYEVNFDGLVGPTHNYSGLSFGNVASKLHEQEISSPQKACLQGLDKMLLLHNMGVKQAIIPPHERPHLPTLKTLGFDLDSAPDELLFAVSSASSMWAANAATFTPSIDTMDGKAHLTVASLLHHLHRSLEPSQTLRYFKTVMKNENYFVVHSPLFLADEGAANHTRLAKNHAAPGMHLFVYGRTLAEKKDTFFPARQLKESSLAIARLHTLAPERCLFLRQNPHAIDAGVFHNDVISTGNESLFLYHEESFQETLPHLPDIQVIQISKDKMSLEDAVESYFFNSQIVTTSEGMVMIAPVECKKWQFLIDELPLVKTHFVNVRESMKNGGGPACLRLRILLSETELQQLHAPILFTEELYQILTQWCKKNYRETLQPQDLRDPHLHQESLNALQELTAILHLGSFYDFQR